MSHAPLSRPNGKATSQISFDHNVRDSLDTSMCSHQMVDKPPKKFGALSNGVNPSTKFNDDASQEFSSDGFSDIPQRVVSWPKSMSPPDALSSVSSMKDQTPVLGPGALENQATVQPLWKWDKRASHHHDSSVDDSTSASSSAKSIPHLNQPIHSLTSTYILDPLYTPRASGSFPFVSYPDLRNNPVYSRKRKNASSLLSLDLSRCDSAYSLCKYSLSSGASSLTSSASTSSQPMTSTMVSELGDTATEPAFIVHDEAKGGVKNAR